MAVDTLGHLLVLHVTPANEQDRMQVKQLAAQVQHVTGDSVEMAYVDQGYTGAGAAQDAETHHLQLEVVKLSEAKKGFVLLPKRSVTVPWWRGTPCCRNAWQRRAVGRP